MWIMSACIVKISHWIEYACGVISEMITLDRRVDLGCAWTSFLSEEILACILRVRLEYVSCVLGYDTSNRYRLDSLSILAWLEIYCTLLDQSQESGEVDSDSPIDSQLFNIVVSENMPHAFVTLVSGAPEIDKQQIIGIKLGGSGVPENSNLVGRFRYHNSTWTILHEDAQWLQLRQILTREYTAPRNLT